MEGIVRVITNTLFVSIPESVIWVLFVFILMKRFDLLDHYRWKENLKWILIPSGFMALSTNIFRFIIPSKALMFIISLTVLYVLVFYVLQKSSTIELKINKLTLLLYIIIAGVAIGVIENISVLLLLYFTKLSLVDVLNNQLLTIVFSIPQRIFFVWLVISIAIKNNNTIKLSLIDRLSHDKILIKTTLLFMILLLMAVSMSIAILGDTGIINEFSLIVKIFVSVSIAIIPLSLCFIYFIVVNYLLDINDKTKQSHQAMFDDNLD